MTLIIDDILAERLANELAEATAMTPTDVVITSLQRRLAELRKQKEVARVGVDVSDIQEFVHAQPERDRRDAELVLGYDGFGLPT